MKPTTKSKPKCTLVIDFNGGWDELFIDGVKVEEDSTLYACDVLHALAKIGVIDMEITTT